MNNKFSLFDNYPFLKPLSDEEIRHIEKLVSSFEQDKDQLAGIPHFESFNDQMVLALIKQLHADTQLNQKAWLKFLEYFFNHGHDSKLQSPTLRSFLLIQIAKKHSLERYLDENERLELAYSALHSSNESRAILLKHAKHFCISSSESLLDLAFKGILLGGALEIDLTEFLPLRIEALKQLIFMISNVDLMKAKQELARLKTFTSDDLSSIETNLKAS